jgi:hypothetical protein
MIQFYDSANIAGIPDSATYAALYGDGRYKTTGTEVRRVKPNIVHERWITVAGYDHCGIADYEPGNPIFYTPGGLRSWVARRHSLNMSTPVVYVDRANIAEAAAQIDGLARLWWIATGDGKLWTPDELAENIAGNWGVTIPAGEIWGNQNVWAKNYDQSNLFLGWWA